MGCPRPSGWGATVRHNCGNLGWNRTFELKMDCASITSIMDEWQVDPEDPTPLHEQVAGEIRRAIAEGEARPGERLPPARDLAHVLGVNANTVLRSLRQLRDEGLLEFRRGRGITVAGQAPKRSVVLVEVRQLVKLARSQGYRREELIEMIESLA